MYEPFRTERLLLRRVGTEDVGALVARRNDPHVARLQAWELPFTEKRARRLVESVMATEDPPIDHWWMSTIADHGDKEVEPWWIGCSPTRP